MLKSDHMPLTAPQVFHLKFKASVPLDDILAYVRKVKEAYPDASIYVKVGE